MAKAKQPVNISGIEFDALIDEDLTLDADVPSYPVEKGYEISDGIILKPKRLSMTLFVGLSVTWFSKFGSNLTRAREVKQKLMELYFKRRPVTVRTSSDRYENMAITTISFRKSLEIGYALEIPIDFREVHITQSETAAIPDIYGATGVNAGTANITVSQTPPGAAGNTDENQSKGSILYNLAKMAGFFGGDGSDGDLLGAIGGIFGGA